MTRPATRDDYEERYGDLAFYRPYWYTAEHLIMKYVATLVRVTDADTYHVILASEPVDLGSIFGYVQLRREIVVRLHGFDAYKRGTEKGDKGIGLVRQWLGERSFRVITDRDKHDKYGRLLASIEFDKDDTDLGTSLMVQGLAVAWDGKGPRPAGLKEKGE